MPAVTAKEDLRQAYTYCDAVARRDKPHLHAASRFFSNEAIRDAFAATYASMRIVDDLVDDIPFRSQLTESQRARATQAVETWLAHVQRAWDGSPAEHPVWIALAHTFTHFNLTLHPWNDLAAAMKSDLETSHFRDWDHLRAYMRGASVAPAIVFMHLVLTRPAEEGRYLCPWPYERVAEVTTDLAIFCYWVHILRDVSRDLTLGGNGLVYLPLADLARFGLTVGDLYEMNDSGCATETYTRLAAFEAARARGHLRTGQSHFPEIQSVALPGHGRALEALVETYVTQLNWLEDNAFDVFANTLVVDRLASLSGSPQD